MVTIKNFTDAHTVLGRYYNVPGANTYTLDRMQALMDMLGNPQDTLRIIHVAGTSGKTSTSYYVSALLAATGAKVGLTVSPHIDEINERLQINNVPLAEEVFCERLEIFIRLLEEHHMQPSYFELLVGFVFWQFAHEHVEYAVVEVGLGGLLDATNVVSRADKVCVITDIGLDHTSVLGKTIAEIAAQKAGIIQPENHVYMYTQGSDVMSVVQAVVERQRAVLHSLDDTAGYVDIAELPLFQKRNLTLAKTTVEYVLERDARKSLRSVHVEQAAGIRVPARMELFAVKEQNVIIDGSHNGQKMQALVTSFRQQFPGIKVPVLVAFVTGESERWQAALDELVGIADSILVTSFSSQQDAPKHSTEPEEVVAYCRTIGFSEVRSINDPTAAFHALLEKRAPLSLVTGSFYLLNHIRPLLKK